ncbi:MAG: tetratricopeptide repeat protein, partial [Candidatus Melainabacteria bacterium]|nr:tetratricopeptide repeat protein [Candidatus Melainabacteria bacterium]
ARIGLALAFKKKGDKQDAVAQLKKVLEDDPDNADAKKYLSEIDAPAAQ